MKKTKNGIFNKVLSSVLSAACVLSTVAFVGTAASAYTKPAENSPATFSWDNASVYFLLTDRFYNGNTSNDHSYNRGLDKNGNVVTGYDQSAAFQGGDFAGITQKIEDGYFEDLGVNAIWMSAPYEQIHGYVVGADGNPSFAHYSYHGYYVLDYTEPDKNFGTKEEFKTLVDTAHEHGIRVVLDVVMNHAGYQSLYDMDEYGFGTLKSGWDSYYYSYNNICNSQYHGYIDYTDSSASTWTKWWGPDWIRCGLPGYKNEGSGDIEGCLASLPDFKTGSSTQVGIPEFLKNKWTSEGTYSQKISKYGSSNTVTGYISDWLAEWVREYGVDGFRCDTAKHVELSAWKTLKDKCVTALREWKAANPTKKLDDLDFWMTGEAFSHTVNKDAYYTQGGFDSMINFELAPATDSSNIPSASSVESYYSRYANSINNDDSFNVLTYISSHDTVLAKGDRKYAGSVLLMMPGGIQIYYGDESNRPLASVPSDSTTGAGHKLRGFMNWDNMDTACLSHWQKLGQFRNNHIAVGAGQHSQISAYNSTNGYTFARTYNKNGIQDTIVATLFATANKDITIDVSSVWSDGIEITNAYDGSTCKVSGGKVTFNSGANGTILMEEPQGAKGKVTVKHINKTTGETIKTEVMTGPVGDSYTTSSLASLADYYTVSSISGSATGTYSETEQTVIYYYVFDSANNGIIKVQYVDDSTGDEIAESEQSYGKIGSTYSVSPKAITNYAVDESKTTNATGTVKSGTTTVVFRYNYVEPTNITIHYYNSNSWSSVAMYVYDDSDSSNVINYTGAWPGKLMTNDGNGWYSGTVDATTATFIANNNGGGSQDPSGVGSKGYSVTGEVWIKGGKIYPTGTVNVKYVDSNGNILATETLKGMADGSTSYTTSAKTFDGYALTSTPSNATGVFSETPVTVTYVYEESDTPIPTDDIIIHYYNSNNWSSVAMYVYDDSDSSNTIKYTGAWPGTLMTSDGNGWYSGTVDATSAKFIANNNGGGSQDPSGVGSTGYSVTGEVWVKNGTVYPTGIVTVKYVDTDGNVLATTTLKGMADGSTSYTTSAKTFDGYTLKTTPSNATGVFSETAITVTYTYESDTPVIPLTNNSTLSKTTINYGDAITITGKATGGTEPYQYSFLCKHSTASSWTTLTSYGTTSTRVWKPTKSGTYSVRTKVKDSTGEEVVEDFTLTVNSTSFTNNSTLSKTTINYGDAITITGKASGGTSPYKYTFLCKHSTASSWTTLTSYGTTSTRVWKPTKSGTYSVRTKVKDSTGTEVIKDFTLTVNATSFTNNSTLSKTTINYGDSITITGKASGGTSPYKYTFLCKHSTASSWTTLTSYGTTSTRVWQPKQSGTYTVRTKVKDSTGKEVVKDFTLTVNSTAFTNNSTLSKTTINFGDSITIKGKATGGTLPYNYTFLCKHSSASSWTTLTSYGTTSTRVWQPKKSGTYTVRTKVKDATGTEVIKDFTLTVN